MWRHFVVVYHGNLFINLLSYLSSVQHQGENLVIIYPFYQKILKYLVASDRLCELGYDEAQVEEALEMFQNCESKVNETLKQNNSYTAFGQSSCALMCLCLYFTLGCRVPAPPDSV